MGVQRADFQVVDGAVGWFSAESRTARRELQRWMEEGRSLLRAICSALRSVFAFVGSAQLGNRPE